MKSFFSIQTPAVRDICIKALILALLVTFGCAKQIGVRSTAIEVRTYASPALDVDSVNTHLIHTPGGVVIFDAQRLLPEAERVLRLIDERPVAAIVISHGHTDHYGGLPVLAAAFPDAKRLSTATTANGIVNDARGFNAMRRDRHGVRFPTQSQLREAAPNQQVVDGQQLNLGGEMFIAAVYGPSEAEDHLVLYHPESRSLFTGDLVSNGVIPVPFENLDAWIEQLDDLKKKFPDALMLYPGHGPSGPAKALIQANRKYLVMLRDAVRKALAGDTLVSSREKADIIFALETAYPHHLGVAGFDRRALLANVIDRVAIQYGGRAEGAADWNERSRSQNGAKKQ